MNVPRLETERLILRGHALEDFDACAAMWRDPQVVRHIGGRPSAPTETWTRLLRYVGHWQLMGFGYWAISEKATGRFVGEAGFADFKREIDPPLHGTPEVGWALVSSAHGLGYATEAIRAALHWGDAHLSSRRTVCLIGDANLASLRVADKCGYRKYAETTYAGTRTFLFERG